MNTITSFLLQEGPGFLITFSSVIVSVVIKYVISRLHEKHNKDIILTIKKGDIEFKIKGTNIKDIDIDALFKAIDEKIAAENKV